MSLARRRPLLRDAAVPRQRARREPLPGVRSARRLCCAAGSRRRRSSGRAPVRRARSSTRSAARSTTSSRHPTPEDDRNHSIKYVLGPESAPADIARSRTLRLPGVRGLRLERERDHPDSAPGDCRRARSAARSRAIDVVILDPDRPSDECPRARVRRDGRLLNAGEAIGEMVGRNARPTLRGLLQQPRGRRRAHAQRLVLVGRPRLPRRGRRVLVRGPQRRLDPRRRRELRRGADRAHPRPVPRCRRRCRLRRARQPDPATR